jgi:hypothetical protein
MLRVGTTISFHCQPIMIGNDCQPSFSSDQAHSRAIDGSPSQRLAARDRLPERAKGSGKTQGVKERPRGQEQISPGNASSPPGSFPFQETLTLAKRQPTPTGKLRTRAHVLADLSINHVERQVLLCNFSVGRVQHDYGYDLTLATYHETGEI